MASAKTRPYVYPGSAGDLIFFHRKLYKHYAVNLGNGEIVHVTSAEGLNSQDAVEGIAGQICSSGISSIAVVKKENFRDFHQNGDKVYVEKHNKTPLPTEEIVRRAENKVGKKEYNLFWNNCEHFAHWCRYGEGESTQAVALLVAVGIPVGAVLTWILVQENKKDERCCRLL